MKLLRRISGKEARDAARVMIGSYVVMLQIPHSSSLRLAAQPVMAQCRDFIAEVVGLDAERVQEICEAEVADIRVKIFGQAQD